MSRSKRVSLLIFFISGIFLILNISIRRFLKDSRYFKIEEIVLSRLDSKYPSGFSDEIIDLLRGRSIFSIKLENISKDISTKYPEFKKIILNYRPPHKVNVEVIKYTPLAKLILNRRFFVDEEARIFMQREDLDLPVITGLQNKIPTPKLYKKYKIPELLLSLELIATYPHKIKRIDASKKENLTFFLDDGLKIKIGDRNYSEKLERLSLLLKEFEEEINDIDYIDLRFSNPIVRYKYER